MKTIYSLQEFRQQLLTLASLKNEDYVNAEVKINHKGKVSFSGYINGYGWHSHDTMEGCLNCLRELIQPNMPPTVDVEIEITEEHETLLTTYDPNADPCFNN